jgi:hypothetical protein
MQTVALKNDGAKRTHVLHDYRNALHTHFIRTSYALHTHFIHTRTRGMRDGDPGNPFDFTNDDESSRDVKPESIDDVDAHAALRVLRLAREVPYKDHSKLMASVLSHKGIDLKQHKDPYSRIVCIEHTPTQRKFFARLDGVKEICDEGDATSTIVLVVEPAYYPTDRILISERDDMMLTMFLAKEPFVAAIEAVESIENRKRFDEHALDKNFARNQHERNFDLFDRCMFGGAPMEARRHFERRAGLSVYVEPQSADNSKSPSARSGKRKTEQSSYLVKTQRLRRLSEILQDADTLEYQSAFERLGYDSVLHLACCDEGTLNTIMDHVGMLLPGHRQRFQMTLTGCTESSARTR